MPPDVSVVMGVHNDAAYLQDAIQSILSQTGVSFEFIIVNDGSTDESINILKEWAIKDERIRLIDQENTGLTGALIRGCREATGEFIARQDGDDRSLPNRLRHQVELLRSDHRLAFVSSFAEVIGPKGEILMVHERPADPVAATELLQHGGSGPPGHGSVMFRRSIYESVGGYRAEFYFAQDCDLWFRLAERGMIGYAPEVLYQYRISPQSLSGGRNNVKQLFALHVDECRALRLMGEAEDVVLEQCRNLRARIGEITTGSEAASLYFLGRNLLTTMPFSAGQYLGKSVRLSPWNIKAWAALAAVPVFGLKALLASFFGKWRAVH